ncbi:MAG: amidohydrolase [Planctomycetes bacterium]|nr:amidohydrolase [Planctomycetota bacterium]
MFLTRRSFLMASGAALGMGGVAELLGPRPAREPQGLLVDCHVHLFGVGDADNGCFLSARQRAHPNFRLLRSLLDIEDAHGPLDELYVARLVAMLRSSSLQRAVVLGQDGRYDAQGRFDREATGVYVPNDWVLTVCERHPDLLIPGGSINPQRADALDEVERLAARGVRLLKIHPPIQAVDPGERRFEGFYRRCAELGVAISVHTGTEHQAEITSTAHCSPARLELALDQGCTAIAAHSGMCNFFDPEDFFADLLRMIRRYPRLYCESSVLGTLGRFRCIPQLLEEPEVVARLLHGSDFPFPSHALVHAPRLRPSATLALSSERNLLERDYRLKLELGVPAEVFERTARVLSIK